MRFGPIAFLFAVAIGWAALRTAMLWPEVPAQTPPAKIAWQPPLPARAEPDARLVLAPAELVQSRSVTASTPIQQANRPFVRERFASHLTKSVAASARPSFSVESPSLASPPAGVGPPPQPRALSFSAWSILRGDGRAGLAAAGQLGGSQAGVRARYGLSPSLALAARVSGPLRSNLGKEVAIALDWQPVRRLPVTLTIERRVGFDSGGRDAFAIGAFGGFAARLPLDLAVDGYGQAGVVGLDRRDLYADGALRIERMIASADRVRVGVGAGVWGGAQPGVSRLDVGPQLVFHAPVVGGGLRIGAEWRQRVAGNARPGSGPALSLGADF